MGSESAGAPSGDSACPPEAVQAFQPLRFVYEDEGSLISRLTLAGTSSHTSKLRLLVLLGLVAEVLALTRSSRAHTIERVTLTLNFKKLNILDVTMLAIEKSKSHKGKCTPNILPCRINHNGPVHASKRYWNPITTPGKRCGLELSVTH